MDLKHMYHVSSLLRFLRDFPLLIESIPNLHQGTQGHSNLNPVFLLWSYHTLNYFHSWSHPVLSYTYHCSFYLIPSSLRSAIWLAPNQTSPLSESFHWNTPLWKEMCISPWCELLNRQYTCTHSTCLIMKISTKLMSHSALSRSLKICVERKKKQI